VGPAGIEPTTYWV